MFLSDAKHVTVPTTHRSRHRHLSGAHLSCRGVTGLALDTFTEILYQIYSIGLGPCCLYLLSKRAS